MEGMLAVLQVESLYSERRHVAVYGRGPARDPQHDVRRGIVAKRSRQAEQLIERNIHVAGRIFVLQRAVGLWQNPVACQKPDRLIQRELSRFHQVQRVYYQWELEDRLHGRP